MDLEQSDPPKLNLSQRSMMLLEYLTEVTRSVLMAVLDFAKAFDKVPHERLLEKIHYYRIRHHTHRWLRNFLTFRTQRVTCEDSMSSTSKVLSGVPQGTVLGPLLFLMYINDLPDLLKSQTRLFADDCLVYKKVENERHTDSLQADLTSLESWQDRWNMKFNAFKVFSDDHLE